MNIVLWVLQVLLAVAFFAHGWLFLSPPAGHRGTDERVVAAVVSAVSGGRGSAGGGGAHPARSDAGHAVADHLGGRRHHDRDGVGNDSPSRARRDELGRHHGCCCLGWRRSLPTFGSVCCRSAFDAPRRSSARGPRTRPRPFSLS